MPGMHGSSAGAVTEAPRVTQSMGEPINSPGAELEITYSSDGKTAIFVSTWEGSIESPGNPYNFDIWMSHYENDTWQPPIHLGPGIDPTVGPNINTSAWELEPSFRMTAMLFISRDMNQVIFCQAISTWFRKSMVSGSPLKTGMMCRNYQTSTRRPGRALSDNCLRQFDLL